MCKKVEQENYFIIHEKLPSMNDYINANRKNKYTGNQMKKKVQLQISKYIVQSRHAGTLRAVTKPCIIFMDFTEKTYRRDVDNVQSSQKFILDAMVQMKIIPDDSPKYVKQVYHNIYYGDEYKCRIVIQEEK